MTIPSTPATTDVGALADEPSELLTNIRTASEIEQERLARKAALRNSAPQETRGDESVAMDKSAGDSLRYCDYCSSWNNKPCGAGCVWTLDMLTVEEAKQKIVTNSKRAVPKQSQRLEREGITDAMCEAAINADVADRIQGFSYEKRHVIRDVWMPHEKQELWSAPVAGPEEYQAFQKQCRIERMRHVLAAALSPVSSTSHSPSAEQQLAEAGKAAIAIRNELDRTRAERDSWEAQFHSAAAAASEYSEFWEKHQRDFDQFGNYLPYSQIDGDLRAAKTRIAALESRIRRAADSSTDPVVARDLRDALTTVTSKDRGAE